MFMVMVMKAEQRDGTNLPVEDHDAPTGEELARLREKIARAEAALERGERVSFDAVLEDLDAIDSGA